MCRKIESGGMNMTCKNNLTTALSIGGGILFGVGVVGGYCLNNYVKKNKPLNGDKILKRVKKAFLEEGPIEGSWIELTKVPMQKFALKTKVYYGGISRIEENDLVQYEFLADAYTGTVLDIYRL